MLAQSNNHIDFQLHTLGWKSFQDLSVTIMSEIFGQEVVSFFDSHDGGRDGAFYGNWKGNQEHHKSGSYTAQCKFKSGYKDGVNVNDLKDDIEKAKKLARKGLAKNYILFTNAQLTGYQEESLKQAFEDIEGIDSFWAYGKERISMLIQSSPRLRMLVPRVYGLGDLSQILDARAGHQAKAILDSLGEDISKFVLTEAYRKSSKALIEHGFVLLLGEPACGKSLIAASLSLGSLDDWGCNTVKICNSEEFIKHWNPNEPNRVFWVDDAFGATQVDWTATFGWAKTFPHISSAIRGGAKVIFTSRDYIYKSAKGSLKEAALPVIKESQVVIDVQDLSGPEKEQILYNHIKLGNQSQDFKTSIKPFLKNVADNQKFSPEIARRLGCKFFTKKLRLIESSIKNFVENPISLLMDVLETLDKQNLSALALIFMRAGTLSSPINLSDTEEKALELLGGTIDGVREALGNLKGSLTTLSFEEGQNLWRYKHPTIRDAFAQFVANDVELMEIYLRGAALTMLFQEVACADSGIEGVSVVLPEAFYSLLLERLSNASLNEWREKRALINFLTTRSNRHFLAQYIEQTPGFIEALSIHRSFLISPELKMLIKLSEEGLLPETERTIVVGRLHSLAVETYDTQFTHEETQSLLKEDEFLYIQEDVKEKVINNIEAIIEDISSDFDVDDDPEECFSELNYSIDDYETIFSHDEEVCDQLKTVKGWIEDEIKELERKRVQSVSSLEKEAVSSSKSYLTTRSIFDDVDS